MTAHTLLIVCGLAFVAVLIPATWLTLLTLRDGRRARRASEALNREGH